jgi:hypothetical protein
MTLCMTCVHKVIHVREDRAAAGRRPETAGLTQRTATAAAATGAVARAFHPTAAHGALGHPGGVQALPYAIEPLLERKPAAVGAVGPLTARPLEIEAFAPRAFGDEPELTAATASRDPSHDTLLQTPTTFPSTATSRVRIGSMVEFSGCSLMWSDSRK